MSISTVGLFFIPLFVKINNMEQQTDVFIPDGMNAFQRNVKRVGDCLIAFVALIVFSPLFLYCYLAVKREDGGPAIFKQERIGRFGKPFYIYPQIRNL